MVTTMEASGAEIHRVRYADVRDNVHADVRVTVKADTKSDIIYTNWTRATRLSPGQWRVTHAK